MSDEYHQVGSTGQTFMNGTFNAILKDTGSVHPDAPGAKKTVLILRYGFYVPDPPNGEGATKFIPDKVMQVPYYRAVDMIRERSGCFITEEEAAPLLEKQHQEEVERARIAKVEADMVIAQRKQELGEIPDVTDSETSQKIASLEKSNQELSQQMSQLIAMQEAFMKQFGQPAPSHTMPDE